MMRRTQETRTLQELRNITELLSEILAFLKRDVPTETVNDDHAHISQFELSTRTYNGLLDSGLFTAGKVRDTSEYSLLTIKEFGKKSVAEARHIFGPSRNPHSRVDLRMARFHRSA